MKEVPHVIEKTGIGADSFHPYQTRINYYYTDEMQGVIEFSKQHPIKKYEELFPPTEFKDVITDKNRERVAQYNGLADKANRRLTLDDCANEEFARIVKRAVEIVYDDTERIAKLNEIFLGIEI